MRKYFKILKMSVKNNTTYIADFLIGNLFLLLIITIYVLLWKKIYTNNVKVGFTFNELIWYLIINETVFSSNMALFRQIESDIKSGSIAYYLNKPYSYTIYIFCDAFGKTILSFFVNLIFGIILGILYVGWIPSFNLVSVMPILFMMILGVILNLVIYICISLTSFWFEENKPFIWVYRQFVYAFGGFLVPITMFPKRLYEITINMPWTYVAFHTSNASVKFNFNSFVNTVMGQILYIIFFVILIRVMFKKGAGALNVNGG